ncbi:superinfection immunity protein [Caballeronia sp. LP003]|uniref:superinfection immunity protein n=1 Tax=Caballeronia sp. LP003 TaxID=3038551 RepID=UPI002858DE33|nr:superinfection immunity protein [Caballeronia sp. LP003]MDR5790264.1 superinfection immunity protein [Caballeronia sp. LP003]
MTIVLLVLFFVPMIVAMCRKHRNTAPIVLVTLLLGWTCIGWLVALIWAFTDNVNETQKRRVWGPAYKQPRE